MRRNSWNTLVSLALPHIPIALGRANNKHTQGALSFLHIIVLNTNFYILSYGKKVGLLDGVSNDETLVRSFLTHFFQEKGKVDIKPFQHYIDETYLSRVLAETKLMSGAPDSEKW